MEYIVEIKYWNEDELKEVKRKRYWFNDERMKRVLENILNEFGDRI